MLSDRFPQVTRMLHSLTMLCSDVNDQTKRQYVQYIVDQRLYCGPMEQIKNISLKNLMKLWCHSDRLYKLMNNCVVKQLCSPPVIDVHINTTLFITGKHSLKKQNSDILSSAIPFLSKLLCAHVCPVQTMHDLRAQLDVPDQFHRYLLMHIDTRLAHERSLRAQFCMHNCLARQFTGSQKPRFVLSV